MNFRSRALLPVLLVLTLAPGLGARPQGGVDKTLFVAVTDQAGKPVKNFTADDILIREDNADRTVVSVKPATQPLSVAILVDTAQGSRVTDAYGTPEEYVRDIRTAVATFAKQIMTQSPDVSLSLMEYGQAAMTIVPYTQDQMAMASGINKLVARPGVGSVLLEALVQATSDLAKRPSPRRAIVSLNIEPNDEQSREGLDKNLKENFRKSGAQLWAVSVQRGGLKNSKRDVLLNDFAKFTGGQRDYLVGISAVAGTLQGYADALAAQYEVVYKRPENVKKANVVLVGTAPGVKVHATAFAPE